MFGIEELGRSFEAAHQRPRSSPPSSSPACVSLWLVGNYTYFGHERGHLRTAARLAAVPVCGMVGGLLGGGFSRLVIRAARGWPGAAGRLIAASRSPSRRLCGLLVAVIGVVSGAAYGTGYDEARGLVEGTRGGAVDYGR